MQLIDEYFYIQRKIYEFFGYVEDWRVIPLSDCRDKFWALNGEGPGELHYADSEGELLDCDGNYYMDDIYTQRHLPKWVYRGDGFTLVCCDPHTDGNTFLRVLDNSKERAFETLESADLERLSYHPRVHGAAAMTIEEQKQQWITDILNDSTNWERFYIFADWLDDHGLALEAEQWRYRGQYFGEIFCRDVVLQRTRNASMRTLRRSVKDLAWLVEYSNAGPHESDRIWCESKGVRYIPHWPATEAELEKTLCTPQP